MPIQRTNENDLTDLGADGFTEISLFKPVDSNSPSADFAALTTPLMPRR
jgi:hypothetical protein